MLWILIALAAQDVSKDDVVRLTREGRSEAEILRAIGSASFTLSADDVVNLKKAGVVEAVLARMVAGPPEIAVENRAPRAVQIRVVGRTIEVGAGDELAPGGSIRLAGTGVFDVTVNGRPRDLKVRTPATLTFRGCTLDDFEVITLYVDDAAGSDTCLVRSRITEVVEQVVEVPAASAPPRIVRRGGRLFRGPLLF